MVRGKRVLVIEDGPTLTHGEMPYGAGIVAARRLEPAEIVDPRPYAVGSIRVITSYSIHYTKLYESETVTYRMRTTLLFKRM